MGRIMDDNLENVLADRFERYSKYIIQNRALPDARDGMKPVQRRILWAMHEAGNTYDKPYHKSAKTVGDVMGKYHPHGDSSIYDAMVRMSQDWKVSIPLIDMQGNNGSIDDDPAAAMRYTEARLSKMANYMMEDIDKDTVSWAPNYSDERMEPTVLPAAYPNLLVGGISGIASGYATEIPTHNLNEAIDAVIYRLNNPKCKLEELMEIIPGPDFPTGGIVMGKGGITDAFKTGKGKVFVRAKTSISKKKTNQQIIITEIPYGTIKSQLVRKIDLIRIDKKIDGLMDVRDESDRTGLKIVIDLKKDANAKAILNYLYKNTDLQVSYNYNMVAIYNKTPVTMSLFKILDAFIEHREDVVTKRTTYDLKSKEKRLHIIEGMIRAISILDDVIHTIKSSKNKTDAKKNLKESYNFSEVQAEAIVMMALYRLTNTDIKALQAEAKKLTSEIKKLKTILKSKKNLHDEIIKELQGINDEIKQPRRSKLVDDVQEIVIDERAMISNEDVYVTISRDGYIRQCSMRSVNANKDVPLGVKEGDEIIHQSQHSTLESLLLITSKGNAITLPVHRIPDAKWKDTGVHLSNLCKNISNEKILSVVVRDSRYRKSQGILLATSSGYVKRLSMDYVKSTPCRAQSLIKLEDDGCVVWGSLYDGREVNSVWFVTAGQLAARYLLSQIPVQSSGKGVIAMKLNEGDWVDIAGVCVGDENSIPLSKHRPIKGALLMKKSK